MKRAAIVSVILLLSVLSCRFFTDVFNSEDGAGQQPAGADLAGYFLPDPAAGLEGLQSYTQTLSISFSGTQDGNALEYKDSYRQELNRETNAQFTFSDITNLDGGAQERIVDGNIGEAYYSKLDDGKC